MDIHEHGRPIEADPMPVVQWASSNNDWSIHRAKITGLYQTENKTLRQVMEIMENEHGFKAM